MYFSEIISFFFSNTFFPVDNSFLEYFPSSKTIYSFSSASSTSRPSTKEPIVPKIDAVNTVGCGDSMIAGFALGFGEGLSIADTLKKASAISAAAALREETGFFVMDDMEKIFPRVEIQKIK